MTEPVPIVPTTAARLPIFADVVGRAFVDDPMIRWPMAEAPDMQDRVVRFFAAVYGPFMEAGTIWEAGRGAGFANWVPPGGASDALQTEEAFAATLAALSDDGGASYEILWNWIEDRIPDDVWYLDMVAVDPATQGTGIGTALVRFGLALAADDGVDAFLETSVRANIPYYERFGFRVVDEGEPVPDCPRIWFMRTES